MAAYTAIDDPSVYFQTTIYSGTGSQQSITNGGNSDLQPDFLWIKERNHTSNHQLMDSVRGFYIRVESNTDTLEVDTGQAGATNQNVTSFDSDGFGVKNGGAVNESGKTYVAWQWKAGTSVSGNTTGSGSATAYSGSVNTTAGISIITYEANGTAGHTIPHHLGAAPKWVMCKSRSENRGWPTQHAGLTSAAYAIFLSSNGAQIEQFSSGTTNTWNNTAASSTVVTLGNNANNNKNDDSYIMYSFAEKQGYSKFGSYTGNGNADGTFVPLTFSPSFIMIKVTSTTSNWGMFDNKRLGFNPKNEFVRANETNAESSDYDGIDFLSNGFKLRTTSTLVNAAQSYIYMAFAESPLVTSTGVPTTAR